MLTIRDLNYLYPNGTQALSGVDLHLQSTSKPAFAGVDPYNKRIDRETDDNVQKVEG